MQMFVLDANPARSARCLCDAHVRVIGREITMCLSAWYAKHMGHAEELPYKPFNHPIADQFDNEAARMWAVHNTLFIFHEFEYRFGKQHASEAKYNQLLQYRIKYHDAPLCVPTENALFTYVGIDTLPIPGRTIIRNLSINQAVNLYRHYYAVKLQYMRVPVTYTGNHKPEWLEEPE